MIYLETAHNILDAAIVRINSCPFQIIRPKEPLKKLPQKSLLSLTVPVKSSLIVKPVTILPKHTEQSSQSLLEGKIRNVMAKVRDDIPDSSSRILFDHKAFRYNFSSGTIIFDVTLLDDPKTINFFKQIDKKLHSQNFMGSDTNKVKDAIECGAGNCGVFATYFSNLFFDRHFDEYGSQKFPNFKCYELAGVDHVLNIAFAGTSKAIWADAWANQVFFDEQEAFEYYQMVFSKNIKQATIPQVSKINRYYQKQLF
ncbi:MAG: hypothetical protein GY710_19340 [Desulfobacteraceae bacterium]|nr:hypothetical protein [Desulfobacteraceae bacterium]